VCWRARTDRRYGAEPAGPRLQAFRHAAGLTQQQVASALGLSAVAVSQWESGYNFPSTRHRAALAALYGVPALPAPEPVRARETSALARIMKAADAADHHADGGHGREATPRPGGHTTT
jgi:transcriptional regulator with XRE-family HTH domain